MDRITKLNEAARLIKEVGRTLDTRKSDCPCCGLTKYEDRTAHGCKEWLDAGLPHAQGYGAVAQLGERQAGSL
jgi:hypothetical protein